MLLFLQKIFSKQNRLRLVVGILVLLLISILGIGYYTLNKLDAENSRLRSNQEAGFGGFNKQSTQEVNLTKKEFKNYLDKKQRKFLDSLNIKLNRIEYLQEYQSRVFSHGGGNVIRNVYNVNGGNIDSLLQYLRDSLKINIDPSKLLGMDSLLVQKAKFATNACLTGTATWIGTHPDSIYVDAIQDINLTFIGERKINKGWFWRDVGRFFTFRWKQIGSDKWETFINAYNNCGGDKDTVILNKKINVITNKKGK